MLRKRLTCSTMSRREGLIDSGKSSTPYPRGGPHKCVKRKYPATATTPLDACPALFLKPCRRILRSGLIGVAGGAKRGERSHLQARPRRALPVCPKRPCFEDPTTSHRRPWLALARLPHRLLSHETTATPVAALGGNEAGTLQAGAPCVRVLMSWPRDSTAIRQAAPSPRDQGCLDASSQRSCEDGEIGLRDGSRGSNGLNGTITRCRGVHDGSQSLGCRQQVTNKRCKRPHRSSCSGSGEITSKAQRRRPLRG